MTAESNAKIDAACDDFEALCKAGESPVIEDFLDDFSEPQRSELLRELLFIDHEYRIRNGDPPEKGEYLHRFPNQGSMVSLVFDSASQKTRVDMGSATQHDSSNRNKTPDTQLDHTIASSPGDRATLSDAVPVEDADHIPPPRLGDYELLEEIGRGGMGVVYRARQISVDRTVAVKLLRRDKLADLSAANRKSMIERFHTESQSAAQLQHDNIVQVFEVGEANDQHFYSMRFVEGESLGDLIQNHPLESRRAAQLIEPVARALEEAHQIGILHRDIKPRNIIVDKRTNRPLLADFGLAKMLQSTSDVTATGDVMGSPPYMSPEQANDAARVDARADIYSLGATLYHLVVGRPPFQAANVAETLRQVWFEEAIPPRQFNPAIDRDLETIIVKCLEKEPGRRFATAAELADELKRFINGEVIRSRPISTTGRFRRWCRRNPVVAALTAVVTLLLIGVASMFGVGYFQQTARLATEQQLRAAADTERRIAVANKEEAERNKEEAIKAMRTAQDAVDEFTDLAIEDPRLRQHGLDALRRDFLNATRQYYDRFVQQRPGDAQLDAQRGQAYARLAGIEADLGQPTAAIELFREAIDVFSELEGKQPDNPTHQRQRVMAMASLAAMYRDIGHSSKAENTLREVFQVSSELAAAHPEDLEYQALLAHSHSDLAVLNKQAGNHDTAEKHWNDAIRLRGAIAQRRRGTDPDNLDELARCHNNLALLHQSDLQSEQAVEQFSAAMDLWQQLAAEHPDISTYTSGLATCQYNLGMLKLAESHHREAAGLLLGALRLRSQLVDKHADVPSYKDELAISYDGVGRLYQAQGLFEEAADAFYQGLQLREDLRNLHRNVPQYGENLVAGYLNLGFLYDERGDYEAAATKFHLADDVLTSLLQESNQLGRLKHHQAGIQHSLAVVYARDKRWDAALQHCQQAVDIYHQLVDASSTSMSTLNDLAESCELLSDIYDGLDDHNHAKRWNAEAVKIRTKIVLDQPDNTEAQMSLANARLRLARSLAQVNDLEKSHDQLRLLSESFLDVTTNDEAGLSTTNLLAQAYILQSQLFEKQGEAEKAIERWDKVLSLPGYDSQPIYKLRRAVTLAKTGQHTQAESDAREIVETNANNPQMLYQGACVLSRAAEVAEFDEHLTPDARLAITEKYLKQGISLLAALRESGHLDTVDSVAQLEHDPDLARLRKHPAYERLFTIEDEENASRQ